MHGYACIICEALGVTQSHRAPQTVQHAALILIPHSLNYSVFNAIRPES